LGAVVNDPRVLEGNLSGWSLVNVVGKELGDEVLALVGNI
jgi:hypothetical protein